MPNNERDLSDPAWGFVGGSAFSLPSSKRNFSRLWAATLETDDGLAVFLDSTVQSVTLSGGNGARHVCELVTCLADKSSLNIRADAFLLCAGALASTCFYQQHLLSHLPDKQFAVGTNLQDHLSVEIARVQVREGFWERFGLRLQHRGILFPRLFMTSLLETEQQVPAGFLHFTYDSSSPLPSWLHDAQRNVQTGEWRQLARHAFRGLQHVGDLAQLAWTFCARERIEWPQSVPLKLTLDLEQYPDAQNKVESLGGRRMAIAWRRMDRDDLAANRIKEYVLSTWSDSPYAKLADLVPATDGQERVAYHPTGTLRMSDAPDWGAVDGNCRVHGLRNAYILSTATFPRCGAANPSLTLLALTERLTATLSPAT
jgi:choline dehydrogenase-like flavoprotein